MNGLSPLTLVLCMQLSVCLLGSTAFDTSLWGKKVHFTGRPCLWRLHPNAVIPALKELSVCIFLHHNYKTEWTGFTYKAPGGRNTELGLGGIGKKLTVQLFGQPHILEWELSKQWSSVCLTWSGQAQRLRTYINGSLLQETILNPNTPQQLAEGGTLTLGVSHYVDANGEVRAETGNILLGEVGLFRIWSREWRGEELSSHSCADGDVVSWDQQQWINTCPPKPDNNLHCAWSHYKIKMWTFIVPSVESGNCSVSLEGVTRIWLESVFPRNISVHDISVSSPSHTCNVVNNTAGLRVQQHQGSERSSNSSCDKCFNCEVHVNVNPAANVEAVQADITAILNLTFSYNFLNLTADPNSISILPVEMPPGVTQVPATVSTGVTSGAVPTQTAPTHPTNMSTTGEPLDLNDTSYGPDTFFRVNMTLSMTGSPTNPETAIERWVRETLEVNDTIVLNLITKENVGRNMEQNNGRMTSPEHQQQYYCSFHVQEYSIKSIAEMITLIEAALTSKYENGSITIQATNVAVKHITPANCIEETLSTIYGQFTWVETFPQVNQEMRCMKPILERAYRLCKLNIETDTTSWAEPDMRNCKQVVTISNIDNITVTTGNAAEVVDILQNLVDVQLGDNGELTSSELNSVVQKLREVVDISPINPTVGTNIASMIGEILLSKTEVTPVANIVLRLTDQMGDNMDFAGESVAIKAPSLALSMVNADTDGFRGLTFGVSYTSPLLIPNTFVNQSFVSESLPDTNATISLPAVLNNYFTSTTNRVQFHFYGTDDLFQDLNITNAKESNWTLNSYIVSASINKSHVSNLTDPVVVTLSHLTAKQPEDKVQCVFWDFQKNSGQGGWNSAGCETQSLSSFQTSCLCNHLTHFAVLLDVSRTPISKRDSQILTVITYIGCGVSSIFLGITILTYIAFEKLRRDYPSKILINLSAALLGLNMIFLLDAWLSSFSIYGLCIATAATLHYFMLASFTWMCLEAVHMYFALVKVFNIYVPSYILKFCAAGWGIPLVIISLVLAVDKDAYGNMVTDDAAVPLQSTDQFCWLQNNVFFYVTVVAFALLVLLCNITVFIVVLIQIRRMGANKPSAKIRSSQQDLRAVASLTVLLGLTWSVGLFSFGPAKVVMMYLFTIFNTLHGLFVFLFHCLMKENVRKQWRIHLCCGRFRLSDYSDWSRSVTVGGRGKKKTLVNSDSLASGDTSTTRKVSDTSTGSTLKNHQQGA